MYQVSAGSQLTFRVAGATLAATTSAVGLGLMTWLRFGVGSAGMLGLIGIGVALLLGFVYAPEAVSTTKPWRFALGLALRAVLYGELALIAPTLVQAMVTGVGGPESLAWFALAVPFGFVLLLPVTVPVGALTTGTLRMAARMPRLRGALLVASIVVLAGAVGTTASLTPPPEDSNAGEPVVLRWTVENHSERDLELGIWNGDVEALAGVQEASWGGSTQFVASCFVSTGRSQVGRDWFLSLGPPVDESADLGDPRPVPLVVAAEVPGDAPRVRFVVAPSGTISVARSAEPPADTELVINLCKAAQQ
jgi:hypothetical protein